MSCRGSTLENYRTSTSNASIDIISTMRQLFTYLRSSVQLPPWQKKINILYVHKELAECINLEDVAKELNDHAANSGHFPKWLVFYHDHGIGGGGGRVAACGYEYDLPLPPPPPPPPPKYGHPPPSLKHVPGGVLHTAFIILTSSLKPTKPTHARITRTRCHHSRMYSGW